MPHEIKKLQNGQFAVIRKDTGKTVGRYATKAKAIGAVINSIEHTEELDAKPNQTNKSGSPLPTNQSGYPGPQDVPQNSSRLAVGAR